MNQDKLRELAEGVINPTVIGPVRDYVREMMVNFALLVQHLTAERLAQSENKPTQTATDWMRQLDCHYPSTPEEKKKANDACAEGKHGYCPGDHNGGR